MIIGNAALLVIDMQYDFLAEGAPVHPASAEWKWFPASGS